MVWKIVVAALVTLIVLAGLLPEGSGPQNTEKLVLIIGLFVFLMMTLLAWAARGRPRAVIILTIASLIWLFFAFAMVASFLEPANDNRWLAYMIGFDIAFAVNATWITAVGINFWRKQNPT